MKPRKSFAGCWLAGIALVALGPCLYFLSPSILFPDGGHSKENAKRYQSLGNLKQVSMCLDLYVSDSDHRYPPQMSSVRQVEKYIRPYMKLEDNDSYPGAVKPDHVFTSLNHGSTEFLGNGSLALRKTSGVARPDRTLMFFDSAPWPNGRRAVTFSDTHAVFMPERDFQAAIRNEFTVPGAEGSKE